MNNYIQGLLVTLLFVAVASADCGYYCCCDSLVSSITALQTRVTALENAKVQTITVTTPNQNNIISSQSWTVIPGTTTNVQITVPSNLIVHVTSTSHADSLGNGSESLDITGFINGYMMTLGNPATGAPTGLGVTNTLQWTTTAALNQQFLNPGNFTFDIRSRLRYPTANPGEVNNPGAVLIIVPV
ncbi:hypothetical protein PPL_00254 [Heterostelium album PN500]|uniref:Uncharacterized protein n=1 Tax=Heterostelium pallidum (strain ATCC 26659 / Pp 5 / PN500) TaxID=670386 RepID=D3AVY8_HETP5|nr:hypothetical protein PPL_00254 [Heterostelium album PN500]EFA86461.1 hypothetical protein PPL_00254 [Heterostelium album PN500]|eukprot:XP_020438566.1 hypothetical protein PPL_00254 [Heterostelium album PN500]